MRHTIEPAKNIKRSTIENTEKDFEAEVSWITIVWILLKVIVEKEKLAMNK